VPGEQLLVVEDNETSMKLFRDVLQASGYRTLEAASGAHAVELAAEHDPDLVLMDIQLPGINGIEALRQLRADPATAAIPIVAVTASAMTQDRQKILAAGFDAYQSKPISIRPFLELVRDVLDRRRSA